MIAGKSLDDIARALLMAVDQEGRPAFKAEDVEAILSMVTRSMVAHSEDKDFWESFRRHFL